MFLMPLAILAATPVAAWGGPAAAAARRAGGKVHVYEVANLDHSKPGTIILTGAITDHGTFTGVPGHPNFGRPVLSKGSFQVDVGDPKHGPLGKKLHSLAVDPKTCAAAGTVTAQVPIVKGTGTGAYRAIRGTFKTTATEASIAQRRKNGKCSTSATLFPGVLMVKAAGTISFK